MKILFDIIYSQQPRRCSSASKFKKLALRLLEWRPDTFIYWRVPEWSDEEDLAWFPVSDRIRYLPHPCSKRDRMQEYWKFPADLRDQVSFSGPLWDADVVITMRSSQVPNLLCNMYSARAYREEWTRSVLVIEEMALTSWRETVHITSPAVQDLMTYLGYLGADRVYVTAEHVRKGIVKDAKNWLAPSKALALSAKLHLVNPVILDVWEEKSPEFRYSGTTPFRAFIAGRLGASSSGAAEGFSALEKNWIWNGPSVSPGVSTQGQVHKVVIPDSVELQHNDRDAFWACMREQAHVVVNNAPDGEFALVLVEPICLGTPAIVIDAEWSRGLLGDDYPFFVKNAVEIYALMDLFRADYEKYYLQFIQWRDHSFRPRLTTGLYSTNLYDRIIQDLESFHANQVSIVKSKWRARSVNLLMTSLLNHVGDRKDFVLQDEFTEFCTSANFPIMAGKLRDPDKFRESTASAYHENWNGYRLILQHIYGWRDGSCKTGHFVQ